MFAFRACGGYDRFMRLIQLLLECGADVNALSFQQSYWQHSTRYGTLFDHFGADLRADHYGQPQRNAQNLILYRRLESSGCKHARPIQTLDRWAEWYYNRAFEKEVEELRLFEDQIDSELS
jgi:hypothetical protein